MDALNHGRRRAQTAWTCRLVALVVSATSLTAEAATLYLNKLAAYRNEGDIPLVIREECRVNAKLPLSIQSEARKLFDDVVLVDDPVGIAKGLALVVGIEDLVVPPGGGWTGSKKMKIKATLYENGERRTDFSRTESSRGGALKYARGNCSIVEHIADELSEELVDWLAKKMRLLESGQDKRAAPP